MLRFLEYTGPREAQALAEWLALEIENRVVAEGESLPAARVLAELLGMHRNTVQSAYAMLAERGFVSSRPGAGTVVSSSRPRSKMFQWRRLWWPIDGQSGEPRYAGDLLLEPRFEGLIRINSEARTLAEIGNRPALVLVGESGLGKSTELARAVESANREQPGSAAFIALADVGDGHAFRLKFESLVGGPWAGGDRPLDLFIDGLDEGHARDGTLIAVIRDCLSKLPHGRVRLRVSCRTNAWTEEFRAKLSEGMGGLQVEEWRLLELRESDVRLAAHEEGVDPDALFGALERQRIRHLTARPITLKLVLDAPFSSDSGSMSVVSLFDDGLRRLVMDPDRPREQRGLGGKADAESRLALARRLAAIALFCNRPLIDDGSGHRRPDDAVTLSDVNGMRAPTDSSSFDSEVLRQLLQSPVFVRARPGEYRFAHKSYAEFLAAAHLAQSGASIEQIDRVLLVREGDTRKIVPALRETAVWLASMHSGFLEAMLLNEPELLVLADSAALSDEARWRLVDAFLSRADKGVVSWERLRWLEDGYARLSHPKLAEQLAPVITSGQRSAMARQAAMDIAAECRVESLAHELIQVATSDSEAIEIRVAAAYALRKLKGRVQKLPGLDRIRAYLLGSDGNQMDQELLGCCLHLIWPTHLSAEELFRLLPPDRKPNYYGAYASFLNSDATAAALKDAEVPIALAWAQPHSSGSRYSHVRRFADAILLRAWSCLHVTGVLDQVAGVVWQRLEAHELPLSVPNTELPKADEAEAASVVAELDAHPERRRLLVSHMVAHLATSHQAKRTGEVTFWLLYGDAPLVRSSDFTWILERTMFAHGTDQRAWAELANRVILWFPTDVWTDDDRTAIAELLRSPDRPSDLLNVLAAIDLDSDPARELQKQHVEWKRLGRPRKRRVTKRDCVRNVFASWIAGSESGRATAWHGIHSILVFNKNWEADIRNSGVGSPTVLTSALWESADVRLRERIVDAAQQYLGGLCPVFPEEAGAIDYANHWSDLEALRIVHFARPEWISARDREWWAGWQDVLVRLGESGEATESVDEGLAALAYQADPSRFRTLLARRLVGDAKRSESERMGWLECIWDNHVAEVLWSYLEGRRCENPAQLETLLRLLMRLEGWNERARQTISRYVRVKDEASEESLSVAAACAAASEGNDGWACIKSRMNADPAWGKRVIAREAHRDRLDGASFWGGLGDAQLAEFVEWLYLLMPIGPLPDRASMEMYSPSTDEEIAEWRGRALAALVARGSREGRAVLETLRGRFPDNWWFHEQLLKVSDNALRRTALTPAELREVLSNPRARAVTSEADLASVALESLRRFETRMQHDHGPLRENLWNRIPGTTPKPKPEPHLSDNIADHLRQDLDRPGVIVDREVEILRRRMAKGEEAGKTPDVVLQSKNPGNEEPPVRLYVEVKWDHNDDVLGSLTGQLAMRYLNVERCRRGVYCVGWTGTSTWDSRKALERELQVLAGKVNNDGDVWVDVVVIDCSLGPIERTSKAPARRSRSSKGRSGNRRAKR